MAVGAPGARVYGSLPGGLPLARRAREEYLPGGATEVNLRMDRSATGPLLVVISALSGAAGCADPVPTAVALATGERGVTAIAVDDAFVYWSKNDGSIKRVSLDGGPATTLVSGQSLPKNIALDGTHVFWTTGDNLIRTASKEGDLPVTLVTEPRDLKDLVVDASSLYWSAEDRTVKRALKVEESSPEPLAADLPGPGALALAGSDVFWTNAGDTVRPSSVMRISIQGGTPSTVIEEDDDPKRIAIGAGRIAIDAGRMYWSTTGDERRVSWAALDGSDVRTVPVDRDEEVTAVAGDKDNAFWTAADGTLSQAAIHGGDYPIELVKGPPGGVVSLALDSTSIYWANSNDSAIMMMPKP